MATRPAGANRCVQVDLAKVCGSEARYRRFERRCASPISSRGSNQYRLSPVESGRPSEDSSRWQCQGRFVGRRLSVRTTVRSHRRYESFLARCLPSASSLATSARQGEQQTDPVRPSPQASRPTWRRPALFLRSSSFAFPQTGHNHNIEFVDAPPRQRIAIEQTTR